MATLIIHLNFNFENKIVITDEDFIVVISVLVEKASNLITNHMVVLSYELEIFRSSFQVLIIEVAAAVLTKRFNLCMVLRAADNVPKPMQVFFLALMPILLVLIVVTQGAAVA